MNGLECKFLVQGGGRKIVDASLGGRTKLDAPLGGTKEIGPSNIFGLRGQIVCYVKMRRK